MLLKLLYFCLKIYQKYVFMCLFVYLAERNCCWAEDKSSQFVFEFVVKNDGHLKFFF
jgi:hypothetical protein